LVVVVVVVVGLQSPGFAHDKNGSHNNNSNNDSFSNKKTMTSMPVDFFASRHLSN
jgi:hypothetical protein